MKERAVHALPLFAAIVLHAWAAGAWAQEAFVATLVLAAIPLGGTVRLGAAGQRALMAAFFAAGAAIGWAHDPELGYGPGTLPRSASLVAVGSLVAAAARLYVRAPWTRERASFVLAMLAVAASGATRLGPAYGAFAAGYLVLAFVALRHRDAARARPWRLGARHHASLVGALVVASLVALGLTRAAPRAYDAVQRAFDRAYAPHDVVGFGPGASLGSMRDMILSDDEVLRLVPPPHALPIDYLRGAAFDLYRPDGYWTSSDVADRMREVSAAPRDDGAPRATVRRVSGDSTRYFVPLRGRALRVTTGTVAVDGVGAIRTTRGSNATEYSFAIGDRDELAPQPPTRADLQIPPSERAPLDQLARAWTEGAATPADALEAIRRNLGRDYAYSLSRVRDADDPLLDFLFQSKTGYCTYFASAMAMLARSRGIPARLVAGYRVSEWSPIARDFVVREKNAHAWVEAWVDGRWRSFDPTPLTELPQDRPHVASFSTLAADGAAAMERGVVYAVEHVTPAQLLAAVGGLSGLWVLVRSLRARRRRAAPAQSIERAARPLACFERLATWLALRGFARAPWESLDRFARRLDEAGLGDAATLVNRYAALRYGGHGDRVSLDRDVDALVASGARRA